VDTQVGSWQTREAEEDSYNTLAKQAVECVFDQICSFGLYVIRHVMFLCFQVHFRTTQTKCFFAYVMLNIICLYVFMFLGMLHFDQPACLMPNATNISANICKQMKTFSKARVGTMI
jgi:hypothetical protein